jgi:hypothetical protein
MARAHSLVTDRKRQIRYCVLALVTTYIGLLPLLQAQIEHTSLRTELTTEHTRTFAGYISREKRFLMYLFNGNAGKAQIA